MGIWTNFKKWALAPDKESIMYISPKSKYDSMVGEPVISFLESFEREPKRYKIELLPLKDYLGEVYYWTDTSGLYKMTDKKTGDLYQAYVDPRDGLYFVVGLPFNLNHWELKAIRLAFLHGRDAAKLRKERILTSASVRKSEERNKQELKARLEYSKRFK